MTWRPLRGFFPAQSVTGEAADTIYQGLNMIMRGGDEFKFLEQWTGYGLFAAAGANTLATGTAAIVSGDMTVTGTGTKFRSELVPGQEIAINGRVFTVFRIDSDTSMEVSPAGHTTIGLQPIALLQQIQELDTVVASLIRGSIIKVPLGHYLGVGRGFVRFNGAAVPGPGWILRDQPQLAVYDLAAGTYTPYPLGMATPTLVAVANVAGGTKMKAVAYSVRAVAAKTATKGWNNPSEPIAVTLAANEQVQITLPGMDTANGQDAWKIYVSLSSSGASLADARQGPWFDFGRLFTTAEVPAAGGNVTIQWADSEVDENDQLEFDNDPAPNAGFVATLGGLPVLLSCNGQGRQLTGTAATTATSTTINGTSTLFLSELAIGAMVWIGGKLYQVKTITSNTVMDVTVAALANASPLNIHAADQTPGSVIRPAKRTLGGYNFEAYPASAAVSIDPPDSILGYYQALERIYLLTANSLNFAELNEDPTTAATIPVITKPYWKVGFRNPRALAFANGYLYGYTTNGATRSAAFGDRVDTEHAFAAPVDTIMSLWDPAKVTVAYNAQLEAICYMHADDGTRPGGAARYGTLLPYMLRMQVWGPPLRMEDLSDVDPTYATSTATVQGKMYFASPTFAGVTNIYQVSVDNGEVGETFLASPFMDMGAEGMDKNVRRLCLTAGRTSAADAIADIYGSVPNGAVPISNLISGASSQSGNIPFTLNTPVVTTFQKKLYVNRLRTVSVRVRLASSGSVGGRVDEILLTGNISEVVY